MEVDSCAQALIATLVTLMIHLLGRISTLAQDDVVTNQMYQDSLALCHSLSRANGIDKVMNDNNLDALVAPIFAPAFNTDWIYGDHFQRWADYISSPASQAGYPLITVPMGFVFGLPVGMGFLGRAFSEPTLIKLASGFEAVTHARRPPQFLPSLEFKQPPAGGPHPHKAGKYDKAFYENMMKNRSGNRTGR